MNISDLVGRKIPPEPWAEGEKIPWHDPAFSERMLREHLSQDHNAASRRVEIIDQHVRWLHGEILGGAPSKILDLCCGPGLYTRRLPALGHSCVGIDYAPASIAYARQEAVEAGANCTYIEADVREAPFGTGYDLVTMVHGELNVFRSHEIRALLEKAHQALKSGGRLVLEVQTLAAVREIGEAGPRWTSSESDLFSDRPHLLLHESFWDESLLAATERYYLIDASSGEVTRYAASIQSFRDSEYLSLLKSVGFSEIQNHPSLGGATGEKDKHYLVFTGKARLPA